ILNPKTNAVHMNLLRKRDLLAESRAIIELPRLHDVGAPRRNHAKATQPAVLRENIQRGPGSLREKIFRQGKCRGGAEPLEKLTAVKNGLSHEDGLLFLSTTLPSTFALI